MNTILTNESLKFVHGQISSHKKERFDIILEPLQAIIIFAFLSKYSIGTKISIHHNVLYIQEGDVLQGLRRWFNNDNKEDLYALYQVFQRFHYFYNYLEKDMQPFMTLLTKMANQGIDNLIETYKGTDKISLLHSLHICKLLLKNPSILNDTNETKDKSSNKKGQSKEQSREISENKIQKVDDVFKNVSQLYNKDYLNSIYYLLKQVVNNKGNISDLYQAYMLISKEYQNDISSWIHNNVVF